MDSNLNTTLLDAIFGKKDEQTYGPVPNTNPQRVYDEKPPSGLTPSESDETIDDGLFTGDEYLSPASRSTPFSSVPVSANEDPLAEHQNTTAYRLLERIPAFREGDAETRFKMFNDMVNQENQRIYESTGEPRTLNREIGQGSPAPIPFSEDVRVQTNPDTGREALVPNPSEGNVFVRTMSEWFNRFKDAATGGDDAPSLPVGSGGEMLVREGIPEAAGYALGAGAASAALRAAKSSPLIANVLRGLLGEEMALNVARASTGKFSGAIADTVGNLGIAAMQDDELDTLTEFIINDVNQSGLEIDRNLAQFADNQAFSVALGVLGRTAGFLYNILPSGRAIRAAGMLSGDVSKPGNITILGTRLLRELDTDAANANPNELLDRVTAFGNMFADYEPMQKLLTVETEADVVAALNAGLPQDTASMIMNGAGKYVEDTFGYARNFMSEEEWLREAQNKVADMSIRIASLVQSRAGGSIGARNATTELNAHLANMLNMSADVFSTKVNAADVATSFANNIAADLDAQAQPVRDAISAVSALEAAAADNLSGSELVSILNSLKNDSIVGADARINDLLENNAGVVRDAWLQDYNAYISKFKSIPDVEIPDNEGFMDFLTSRFGTAGKEATETEDAVEATLDEYITNLIDVNLTPTSVVSMKDMFGEYYPKIVSEIGRLRNVGRGTGNNDVTQERLSNLLDLKGFLISQLQASDNEAAREAFQAYAAFGDQWLRGSALDDMDSVMMQAIHGPKSRERGGYAKDLDLWEGPTNLLARARQAAPLFRAVLDIDSLENLRPLEAELASMEMVRSLLSQTRDFNQAEFSQLQSAVGPLLQRVRETDPALYTQIENDLARISSGELSVDASRETLEAVVKRYNDSITELQANSMMDFLHSQGLIAGVEDLGEVAGREAIQYGARPNAVSIIDSFFTGVDSTSKISNLLDALPENDPMREVIKAQYIRFTKDRIFNQNAVVNFTSTNVSDRATAVNDVRSSAVRAMVEPNSDYMTNLRAIYEDSPEVADGIEYALTELADIMDGRTTRLPNIQGSPTAEKDNLKKAVSDVITFVLGPLSHEGAQVRILFNAIPLASPERAKMLQEAMNGLFDNALTDVNFMRQLINTTEDTMREKIIRTRLGQFMFNATVRPTAQMRVDDYVNSQWDDVDEQTEGALSGR